MNKVDEVWIVDDDRSIRWVLEKALEKAGIKSRSFSNADLILEELNAEIPDAIITDIRMPGLDGLTLLKRIQ
ncbi:MAG: Nitrogen regulation protein, partial [Pseudomonadota bacterium]